MANCVTCPWEGPASAARPNPDGGFLCPECGGHIIAHHLVERVPTEDVVDVPGAENMEHAYGARFKGWYLFKEFLRKETVPVGWKDQTFCFKIFKFEARFMMTPRIEFPAGVISYTLADREFGVFRFPRTVEGEFTTPVTLTKDKLDETLKSITEEDLKNLLKAPAPLVFNSFKIPRYGFDYLDISDSDVQELELITTKEHALNLKKEHEDNLSNLLKTIRNKIETGCNYLSILQNVLDRNWVTLTDLSLATGDIIHI